MHRLLYTSTARRDAGITDSPAISELAQRSASANAARGLTGVLVNVEGRFIQVIEGRLEELDTLFERICCDFRHWDVQLIDLEPIEQRKFADWGMACLQADSAEDEALANDLHGINYLVGVNASEAVRELRRLLERQRFPGANY